MSPGMAARRATLADVAERAGVSKKTVSNVVNEFPFVTAATRARVLAAIEDLDYRPNLSARNLARGRTGVVALVIPELHMPYFSELASEVIRAAERFGWTVLIEQTLHERSREKRILDGALASRIDGLLFSPTVAGPGLLRDRADRTPMVLLGEHLYDDSYDHVSIDNVAAARTATEHLIGNGRTRIAAIGARRSGPRGAAEHRLDGYRAALRAAGLAGDPERADRLVARVGSTQGEAGEQAMDALFALGEPPDGVFCFTDWLALGALRSIHRHGYRVPEDIAVVGHDDIPYGRICTPALTTIAPDKRSIADQGVDLLERRIAAWKPLPTIDARADFELVVRESA